MEDDDKRTLFRVDCKIGDSEKLTYVWFSTIGLDAEPYGLREMVANKELMKAVFLNHFESVGNKMFEMFYEKYKDDKTL